MKGERLAIGFFLLTLLITSCGKQRPQDKSLEECNSVYYWRTDLRLDSTEKAFLNQYHIQQVYCRYFDVVMNDHATEPSPNATISFSDTLPSNVEMIPTVYITEDCMHKPHKDLAKKIVDRIVQMNETNNINHVHEIQIDCDYTSKSRATYYKFLEEVKANIASKSGSTNITRLSTTIRLHQLSMPAPPVDYGVLMVYNTGNPQKWQERNPILDYRDVYPYLSRLDQYPLPLATAYPVYQWTRNIQNVRVDHTVTAEEILKVKHALEKERHNLSSSIITYHLDKDNINRYKPNTYEEIYHH